MNKAKISDAREMDQRIDSIIAWLSEQKAIDPILLKPDQPNSLADAVVIASASSRRHAQGLARGLLEKIRANGGDFLHMEGYDVAHWILLDCNDLVVHIFQPDARDLYRMEELFESAGRPTKEKRP